MWRQYTAPVLGVPAAISRATVQGAFVEFPSGLRNVAPQGSGVSAMPTAMRPRPTGATLPDAERCYNIRASINCIDGFCSDELHHNARFCLARARRILFLSRPRSSFSTCHLNPVRPIHAPEIANIPTAHRSTDRRGTPPFARTAETKPPFPSGRQRVGLFIVHPACTCGATAFWRRLLPFCRRPPIGLAGDLRQWKPV